MRKSDKVAQKLCPLRQVNSGIEDEVNVREDGDSGLGDGGRSSAPRTRRWQKARRAGPRGGVQQVNDSVPQAGQSALVLRTSDHSGKHRGYSQGTALPQTSTKTCFTLMLVLLLLLLLLVMLASVVAVEMGCV